MSTSPDGSTDDSSLESSAHRPDESSAHNPDGSDSDDSGASNPELICYRCDRPLEGERWIRLDARPGPGVADAYNAVTKPCCPDCVAAIGLLEIATGARSRDAD
ncbi:hypothetical protein AB7C87_15210 [Natrarchaeobius sp. A-rgal3]|uniref:hypothetical protein n=1 Tax=Natrarchaeobius versutus TaxID=1679078 RepID=UPI00350F50CE